EIGWRERQCQAQESAFYDPPINCSVASDAQKQEIGPSGQANEHPQLYAAHSTPSELAPFQLIELHFGPRHQGRIAGYRIGEDQSGGIETILQTPDNADAAIDRAAHNFISQVPRLYGCKDQGLSLITPKWRKR